MVGASKILTVSYGTFSCTLEGFEEPFSTMKAIAEYFRDLAADDRYFGAEPPTPDAEMLHRIAEREVQRRVEARVSENGVLLRQEPAPAEMPKVAATPATAYAPAPATAEPAVSLGTTAPAPQEMDTSDADIDSISAKLKRIRAVVAAAKAAPAPAFEDDEPANEFEAAATAGDSDFGFDLELDDLTAAEAAAEAPAPAVDAAPVPDVVAEAVPEVLARVEDQPESVVAEAPVAEAPADLPAETVIAEFEAVQDVAPTEVEAEDVAAEDDTVEDDTAEEDAFEDEIADEAVAEEDEAAEDEAAEDIQLADVVADFDISDLDLQDDIPEDEDEAALATPDAVAEDEIDLSAVLAAAEPAAEIAVAEETAEDRIAAALRADFAEEEFDAEPAEMSAIDDAPVAEKPESGALDLSAWRMDEAALAAEAASTAETDPAAKRPNVLERARNRIIRIGSREPVKRDEDHARTEATTALAGAPEISNEPEESFDADALVDAVTSEDHAAIFSALQDEDKSLAEVALDDETDIAKQDAIEAAIGTTGLDRDDEEELLSELANIARDGRRDPHEGRAILETNGTDGDASVERLMEEAKSKLEGSESRRRHSAITHLKAAVAATVADRKMKSHDAPGQAADQADEDLDRYREDLSRAVRPRRPTSDQGSVTRRPTIETRLAPLVLVSEQRVDGEPDAAGAASVRPRRISAGRVAPIAVDDFDDDLDDDLSPEDAKSFAEFVERLGATSLAEMLEAAAAYTATVEGRPHFSRPHLLRKVAYAADDEEFSREDGLRSFGMLLRQGKLQKISRGQFTITEQSRFMNEARRAAN